MNCDKLFPVSLIVTTKQKPIIDTGKKENSKHTTTEKSSNHKGREQEKKKVIEKNYKENLENKIAIRKHLSIITLSINGLNFPVKRQSA